jgi:hypothetical protein
MGTTHSQPPGPIIMMDQSKIPSRSQVQIITLFFWGAHYVAPFINHGKLHEFDAEKPIS